MSSLFSNNSAATLIQGSQPALQTSQGVYEQAFQQNAALDQQSASLVEQTSALNAENAAIEGKTFREQQAQGYNNSGVLLEGSPMKVLEQTRQMAQNQVNSIISTGQQTSNQLLTQANQTLNAGYVGLLGQSNDYLTSLAQAKIASATNTTNGLAGDLTQLFSFLGSGGSSSYASQLWSFFTK